jgi:hypothetical protein
MFIRWRCHLVWANPRTPGDIAKLVGERLLFGTRLYSTVSYRIEGISPV